MRPLSRVLCLAALLVGPVHAAGPRRSPAPTAGITCHVYYRAAVTQPIQDEVTLEFSLGGAQQGQQARFADLEFHASFFDDPYDGRSLVVHVSRRDTGTEIVRQLYQIPRESLPRNQFLGNHGFSGLGYVYHPESGAELQFLLEAR